MTPAVEPDFLDFDPRRQLSQKFDDAVNVIDVDMADDHQLKDARAADIADASDDVVVGARDPAVYQNAAGRLWVAIFDPQAIAVVRWEHFDCKHVTPS